MPETTAIQIPPNILDIDLKELIELGVDDLGGISSITQDHINPDYDWPEITALKKEIAPYKLKERLAVYPQYINQQWLSEQVLNCIKREGWFFE